jgi:hypothetical protein
MICTVNATGTTPLPQTWFVCVTCGHAPGQGMCQVESHDKLLPRLTADEHFHE